MARKMILCLESVERKGLHAESGDVGETTIIDGLYKGHEQGIAIWDCCVL